MNTIGIQDCLKCGNPLTLKEFKAQAHHCSTCSKLIEAAEHQEQLSNQIHNANRSYR